MKKTYSYSSALRFFEVLAISVLFVLWGIEISSSVYQLATASSLTYSLLVFFLAPLLAYLAADLVSGTVHFVADNFGTVNTFFFGSSFIKPFREHHSNPKGILEHDFIELNGANAIISIPVIGCCFLVGFNSFWAATFHFTMSFFFLAIFFTNMFHQWAHMDKPPRWIHRLQRWGLVLPKSQHDIHHTPPFKRYYCITVGWLNPVLDSIRYFETLEWVLSLGRRSPFAARARRQE